MTTNSQNLLLVDDDTVFCDVLRPALERRGFAVTTVHDVPQAMNILKDGLPDYAIVDLCMPGPSGLKLVSELKGINDQMRIIVLTGYASIATAVEAIKLGATHYLTKPADTNQIVQAFKCDQGNADTPPATRTMSVNRLEWEHIQSVLTECNGNISAAARRLGMHRRTLQRKLNKRPTRQ